MKQTARIILVVILVILVAALVLVLWLSAGEYRPAAIEELSVDRAGDNQTLAAGQSLNIMSWNIGYGGLGADSDFFMDGGKDVKSADESTVKRYLSGIASTIEGLSPDIALLQEVDINSARSYGINQAEQLWLTTKSFALNYSCPFVPYPLPPIGRVNSGLMTTTDNVYVQSAQRIALPCPFSWPVSVANLKRCMMASYLPIADENGQESGKYLVLVNLHLEAYDDGEGKAAQTKQLVDFVLSEYEKGNYVIAGGDFNQAFPGSEDVYPLTHAELWEPGSLALDALGEDWALAYDSSSPTCRLLNQPFDPTDTAGTQYFVIDGFILSPNVQLNEVHTLDEGFANSDHNPVAINVTLN